MVLSRSSPKAIDAMTPPVLDSGERTRIPARSFTTTVLSNMEVEIATSISRRTNITTSKSKHRARGRKEIQIMKAGGEN